jgi:hypothetical protein
MYRRSQVVGVQQALLGKFAVACLLLGLYCCIPVASGQTPETLTGPGTFVRGIATIILQDSDDSVGVVVEPVTGVVTIEVLAGTATVMIGEMVIELPTGAVVEIEQLPETGAIRITVVAGPAVTVTSGGVTVAVPAGTGTTILPGGVPPPPALSVETAAPPPPSVRTPVIGREVPLSPTQ